MAPRHAVAILISIVERACPVRMPRYTHRAMPIVATRREFIVGAAALTLGCQSTPTASKDTPLVVGGLPVTCNLTLPVACAARLLEKKAGKVGTTFEYSKYSGWPEI